MIILHSFSFPCQPHLNILASTLCKFTKKKIVICKRKERNLCQLLIEGYFFEQKYLGLCFNILFQERLNWIINKSIETHFYVNFRNVDDV